MHFQLSLITLALAAAHHVSAHTLFTTTEDLAKSATEKFVAQNAKCSTERAFADPPAIAKADGTFEVFARSFTTGKDGATAVETPTLDTTGKGTDFPTQVKVVTDGNKAPPQKNEIDKLIFQLPGGITCTGPNNTCLVQIASISKFSNCIPVQLSGASSSNNADASDSSTPTDTASSAAASETHKHKHHHHHHMSNSTETGSNSTVSSSEGSSNSGDTDGIVTITLTVTVTPTPTPTGSSADAASTTPCTTDASDSIAQPTDSAAPAASSPDPILLDRHLWARRNLSGRGRPSARVGRAGAKRGAGALKLVRSRAFRGVPEEMYV